MKILVLFITVFLSLVIVSCKRQTLPVDFYGVKLDSFQKSYGGSGDEVINSIIQSSDGNYSFTGTTTTLTNGSQDVYVGQTDANGALLWSKAIGGASSDGGCDIIETPDHNLLIAGYSKSYNTQNFYEVFLLKVDFQGNIIWQKTISDGSSAYKIMMANTNDGYLITGGATGLFSATGRTVYFAKIGFDGSLIWSKQYSGGNGEIGKSMCYDNAGNIMLIGSPSIEYIDNDLFILKLKPNGDSVWTKNFAGNGYEVAGNILSIGNNYYINSSSGLMANPLGIIYWNKSDTLGNIVSQNSLQSNYPYAGYWITPSADNNILITGAKSDSTGINAAFLMKSDYSGNIIWNKNYTDSSSLIPNRVIETSDAYILAGYKQYITGSLDALIIKVKK